VAGVIERFLEAMVTHDWREVGACVAPDVVRVGPYGDTYRGRQSYVAFLAGTLPSLPGYRMQLDRVTYAAGGTLGFAELSETVTVDGAPLTTPESLVFEIGPSGLIESVSVYVKHTGGPRCP